MVTALLAAAVIATALAGCSATQRLQHNVPPKTCGDFAKASSSMKKSAASKLAPDPIVTYRSSGADVVKGPDALTALCAGGPKSELLSSLVSRQQNQGQKDPSCSDFLALPSNVQSSWAEAFWGTLVAGSPIPSTAEVSALVTGCSNTQSPESTIRDAAVAYAYPTTAPGTTAATIPFTDYQGYKATVVIATATPSASSSVTSAPPGKADLTFNVSVSGTLANTTPARTLATAPFVTFVDALAPSSALCTSDFTVNATGTMDAHPDKVQLVRTNSAGCYFVLGTFGAPSLPLAVNQTVALAPAGTNVSFTFEVAESQASQMVAEIKSSTILAISDQNGWTPDSPLCTSSFDGWLGHPDPILASTGRAGCA